MSLYPHPIQLSMIGSLSWRRTEKLKLLNNEFGMGTTLKFGTIVISIKSLCANNNPSYWSIDVRWQLSASWMVNFSIAIAGLPTTTWFLNGSFCSAGRSRWRTENENHNVLKTRGYHLEHNFGHGQQHLSSFLLTLNLLAFLWPTVLHLVDERYQRARIQRGTRRGFFQDVICLTKYLLFESWHHLLDFMLDETIPVARVNSSWLWIGCTQQKLPMFRIICHIPNLELLILWSGRTHLIRVKP